MMEDSVGPEEHQKRRVVFTIMKYLQDQLNSGEHSEESVESLEVALDCIGQVFHLDLKSQEHARAYDIGKPLEKLIPATVVPSSSSIKEAEIFKTQGNVHIKNGEVDKAVECYTRAIELDPTNATYFCNRAAGRIKQQRLREALEDCQESVKLNPEYARAHGRMGYVYSSWKKYAEAKKCFDEATRLDPENQSYKENLATVEQQLREQSQGEQQQSSGASSTEGSGGGGGGFPGLGGLNIGNVLNNPAFMNMASTLMSQPGFQQMAGRMMGNMASRGEGRGEEEMMPQMMEMARDMQRNNPELYENLQQQAQGLANAAQQPPQNPNQQ